MIKILTLLTLACFMGVAHLSARDHDVINVTIEGALANKAKAKALMLSMQALDELPSSIGELSELQVLDLYMNELTSLPHTIGQLSKLEQIMLEDNVITSLPVEMCDLTQLKCFSASITKLACSFVLLSCC